MSDLSVALAELLRLQDSVARLNEQIWDSGAPRVLKASDRADRLTGAWRDLDLLEIADRIAKGRRAIDELAEAAA